MYKFRMSIGDWSDDGHGRHEDFIVESNVPVEAVREAHFAMEDATGVNIEKICSYFDESVSYRVIETLKDIGFEFECPGATYPEEMARLWVFLLEKTNPNIKLRIVKDEIPTLHFYGFDEKNRHIDFVGYGLF